MELCVSGPVHLLFINYTNPHPPDGYSKVPFSVLATPLETDLSSDFSESCEFPHPHLNTSECTSFSQYAERQLRFLYFQLFAEHFH